MLSADEKFITKSTSSLDPTLLQIPIKDRRRRKRQGAQRAVNWIRIDR